MSIGTVTANIAGQNGMVKYHEGSKQEIESKILGYVKRPTGAY